MPQFSAFRALTYSAPLASSDWSHLICPPYDVLNESEIAALRAMNAANAIALEIPDAQADDPYAHASRILDEWIADDILCVEEEAFYVYAMGFTDEFGIARQLKGVLGRLDISSPAHVHPHEQTTAKDVTDRLSLLQSLRTNLSPVWTLCPTPGFTEALQTNGPPFARATVNDVHHRIWKVRQPAILRIISEACADTDVLIADGHHRISVARQYWREQGAKHDDPSRFILTFMSELSDDALWIEAIHRVFPNSSVNNVRSAAEKYGTIRSLQSEEEAFKMLHQRDGLIISDVNSYSLWEPHRISASVIDSVFSERVARDLTITPLYQHGNQRALAMAGELQGVAILQRPVDAGAIAHVAVSDEVMPPKSTFFTPKPATGFVFHRHADQH